MDWSSIVTSIGTLALAFATACMVAEMSRQRRIERYTGEMRSLILPLKTIYELGIRRHEFTWWTLYTTDGRQATNPTEARKLLNAIDDAELNKHLAPSDLYTKILEFLDRLKEMKRSQDEQFQKELANAIEHLYTGGNVYGGFVELRYDKLRRELDSLDNVKRWQFWK